MREYIAYTLIWKVMPLYTLCKTSFQCTLYRISCQIVCTAVLS